MSSRRTVLALLLAALLAPPLALADGEDAPREYDPLNLSFHGHLSPEGRIVADAPAPGRVPFAPADEGGTGSGGAPLAFAWRVPVTFVPASGLTVTLVVEADAPLPARDAQGRSFELRLLHDGEPLDGATAHASLASAALVPGQPERVEMTVQAPGATLPSGSEVVLEVRPVMPTVPADTLYLKLGADGSRADFERMRVPSVADLGLNPGLLQFHLDEETYVPADPDTVLYPVRVLHDAVPFGSVSQPVGAKVQLVLRGEETGNTAQEAHGQLDASERAAAAHAFRIGDRLVHVHPRVGVVVPLTSEVETTIVVECVANCPPGGFNSTVRFRSAEDLARVSPPDHGGLIPPKPDTTGIPVSKDAPADERAVPGAGAPAALATALLAAAALAGTAAGRGRAMRDERERRR